MQKYSDIKQINMQRTQSTWPSYWIDFDVEAKEKDKL